jgi:hypothetical protein
LVPFSVCDRRPNEMIGQLEIEGGLLSGGPWQVALVEVATMLWTELLARQ